ncbi:hypothetical protein QTP88_015408 [Uroleucon formosanum]
MVTVSGGLLCLVIRASPPLDLADKIQACNLYNNSIFGWGKTISGSSGPILLEASSPYIDNSSCRKSYKNGFEQHLTVDKFRAGLNWNINEIRNITMNFQD